MLIISKRKKKYKLILKFGLMSDTTKTFQKYPKHKYHLTSFENSTAIPTSFSISLATIYPPLTI